MSGWRTAAPPGPPDPGGEDERGARWRARAASFRRPDPGGEGPVGDALPVTSTPATAARRRPASSPPGSGGAGGAAALALLLSMALLAACGNNMRQQPKYTPLEPSSFFADGQSARQLPPDTVARGQLRTDEQRYTGKVNGTPVVELPYPVTKEMLQRGQERFDVYCAVCHGRTGYGDGMIAQRGFPQPPSFHTDRLRGAPVGHFYDVITNGYGVMYSYAARVAPDDRWAIAAYIRALQLSQHASLDDVPPDERQKLETER